MKLRGKREKWFGSVKGTKKAEIEYPLKLDRYEVKWLYTKPFGYSPRGKIPLTTAGHLQDFADILFLLNLPPKSKILDVGCGPGWTSEFLAKMSYNVTGIDISPHMIKIAKRRTERLNNIKFDVQDVENLQINDTFDGVLIYDALHHVPNEKRALLNIFNVMKIGGKLVIMEPGKKHEKLLSALLAMEKYGTLEKGYSREYLVKLLETVGFKEIKTYTQLHNLYQRKLSTWSVIPFHVLSRCITNDRCIIAACK